MPELPEVERVRRTIAPRVIGRTIESVSVHRREVVATERDPTGGFSRSRGNVRPSRLNPRELLQGAPITSIERLGKQLALVGAEERVVCVHLGMTGHLEWVERPSSRDHVHVAWQLDDGSSVEFRDPRRFGGLWTLRDRDALYERRWDVLGPDALQADGGRLFQLTRGTPRSLKSVLLDQRVLAGVGNIYADEALFRAGLRPGRCAGRVSLASWERLAQAIRSVLSESIEAGGSTIRDYADGEGNAGGYQSRHAVYGRSGEPCVQCGTTLRSRVIAQRTTVYCPTCQR